MKEIFSAVARELKKDASTDEVTALIRKHISRRQFLAGSGALGLGVATFSILGCGSSGSNAASEAPRQVFVANALGMVVSAGAADAVNWPVPISMTAYHSPRLRASK
jgi:uncharacterized protein (DUF1501 family)